ncbi:CDP-diacylglycerol--glycerol-3-phosphate 3-phosphatidyltransferase [Bifidobacterium aquikefiricola]|uniref:CDP-diacylglycerol--glycerol-3-phosphate 3-phosphatidyltransferase n=1 Tax=Bifidobacterium aquikefiricola TaxID=3059038 RepID=A0AB39U9D7_9BIFI
MRADAHVRGSLFDGWNSPPNLVTYVRIVLVVVFLALYIASGRFGSESLPLRWSATVLFIIAASTDKLDGWMARKYNQVTELGKLLDPIADKLLILAALVVASCFGEIAWWVTALFVIRELGITVMRFMVIDSGGSVIAASKAGKYKTLFECCAIALLLAPIPAAVGMETASAHVYTIVTAAVVYIALILCLYSGAEYLYHTLRRSKQ